MKSFLKYTLATIVGFLIVNVFLLFVFFGIVGAFASMGEKPVEVKSNSILELRFDMAIPDRSSSNPVENFDLISFTSTPSTGLNKILETIKKAAKDDRISGIYMELTDIQSNFGALATIEEIRNALLEFKKSGKFIYSYSNLGYSQKSYYLATASDSIFVNPETPLMLSGMGGNLVFYKNMLDKIGIQAEIVKVGKYKSAVEPFTRTEISEANREQIQSYLQSMWGTLLAGISETRHVSVDTLNWLANTLKFRSPEEELSYGLYDGVCYEDQIIQLLKERCGVKQDGKLNRISLGNYQKVNLPAQTETSKNKIAVIYASGEIGMKQSASSVGPELAQTIRKAREDKNIKAIVMRVNSPGGSALTSDIIWREVVLARQVKPFIVSMGNVAASGGYYISCAADTIVADPTTLTGSIGIFGQFFNGEKLIQDKIGLTVSTVKTNEHSDFGGAYPLPFVPVNYRPFTAYERNVLQNYIEKGYETFLNRVATGRHKTRDEIHEIAQGRVWTGEQALGIGLVDVLGGMEDAIKIAADKAGLEHYKLAEYPEEKNPFQELFGDFFASVKARMIRSELGDSYELYSTLKNIANTQQGLVTRVPYNLEIN